MRAWEITPLTVNGKGTQTRFTYGPNQMRHKQVRTTNGDTTTTHYLDKLYEIDLETNHWRAYIGEAAQLAWTQDNGLQLLFTLKDRLGSATTLVNQDGQLISRRYFDPFGKSASELPSALDTVSFGMTLSEFRFTDLTETNRYRRGFTGHEHLNEQQLIHMNGRIYDYNLGRFMSVDPVIQSPANTQSVNPYSYIMNNPLAGTDPTGYTAETDAVQVEEKDKFLKDGDGNVYLDKGGDSLIKVDSVTVTNSNGTSSTTSFGSGGAVADISFTNDSGVTFSASEIGSQIDVAKTGDNGEGTNVTTTVSSGTRGDGDSKFVDNFIKNHVNHTTEDISSDKDIKSPVPDEVRAALIELSAHKTGRALLEHFIKSGTKLDLVDTTLTRTEENGTLGFAFMAGYGEDSEFPDTVYYTRNLTAFRSYISKSSPFILDSVVNSMSMDVLLAQELGHTRAGNQFGINEENTYTEIVPHSLVENRYRAERSLPIRRSYFKKDDMHNYMNSIK